MKRNIPAFRLLPVLFVAVCVSIFSERLNACNASSAITVAACDSFVSPSGKYTWKVSGLYQDTIKNDAGCDSFMLINLAVNNLTAEHSQHGDSLVANDNADYYQWINCDLGNTPIVNDTNRVFYPPNSGNYAVIVQHGGCADTSACAYYKCIFGTVLTVNACEPYLSPSGKYIWNISGFYTDTITHPDSCVELFSITLTVNNQRPSVTQTRNDLVATGTGTIFQWINCDSFPVSMPGDDTSSSFNPLVSGTYAVIVTTNGCADTSDCFQFNMVGLHPLYENNLRIYPNPAAETVYVESETPVAISLYTPDGRLIKAYVLSRRTEIVTATIPSGTYIIRARNEKSLYTGKLVVIH